MKKLIATLLVLVLSASFVACGGGGDDTGDTSMENTCAIILQIGGLGDQGYNDGAKIGLDMMTEKYDVQGTLVEAAAPAEADTFVRQLAEDGYPLIICLDWIIIDYVREVSKDYPDTLFVVLGKALPGPGTQENLIEPFTALHEWAFMACLASLLIANDDMVLIDDNAKPGTTIGIINAGESVNQGRTRAAYDQCIDLVDPSAVLIQDYTGSYTDSALNQQIAENMYVNQGVEVIWPVLGTGALATFTTAKLNNGYVLGCDSNQDHLEPGYVPTSVLHNTTYMVTNIIEEWKTGTLKGTNEYYWGLKSGVVGLTDFATAEGTDFVNQESLAKIKEVVKEYTDKIVSGELLVYNFFLEDNVEYKDWKTAHPDTDYTEWVNAGRP